MRRLRSFALAALGLAALPAVLHAQINGAGTDRYLPRWTGASSIGNSVLFQYLSPTGNGEYVGINTLTPGGVLGIQSKTGFEVYGHDAGQTFNIYSEGDMALLAASGKKLHLGANGTNSLMVLDNNRVGIGTMTPATPFNVAVASQFDSPVTINAGFSYGLTFNSNITYEMYSVGTGQAFNIFSEGEMYTLAGTGKGLHWGAGGTNDQMVLTSAGNVGIGTTTPASKFTVNGLIHSTSGGIKFPDGTVQTTAGGGGGGGGGWTDDGTVVRLSTGTDIVGIGTTTPDPAYKLSVNGSIRTKECVVNTGWSDFVFEDDYKLRTLEEVEQAIETLGHLPDVPSAAQVNAEGIGVGQAQTLLLQKVEELTLYLIQLKKDNVRLQQRVTTLEASK